MPVWHGSCRAEGRLATGHSHTDGQTTTPRSTEHRTIHLFAPRGGARHAKRRTCRQAPRTCVKRRGLSRNPSGSAAGPPAGVPLPPAQALTGVLRVLLGRKPVGRGECHISLVGGLGREDSSRQVVSFGTPPGRRRTRHRPYRHRVRFTFDARRADRGADISVVRNRGAGNGNRGEQGRRSSFMTEVGAGVDGGLGIASRLLTEYPSRSGWLLGPPSLGCDPGETRTHGSPAPVAGSGRRGRIPRGVAGGCGASCGASTAGYTRPRAAACRSTRLPTPGRHHGRGCQVELPCTDVEEMLFDLFLCRQLRGD